MTPRGLAFMAELSPHEYRVLRQLCLSFRTQREIGERLRMTRGAVKEAQYRLGQKADVYTEDSNREGRFGLRHRLLLFSVLHEIFPAAELTAARMELEP